jgi:hypothetical protein
MSSNNFSKSILDDIHYVIRSSMISYPKEIIIETLRDYFAKDTFYHYARDKYGHPNVTDHTGLPLGADLPIGAPGSTAESNDYLPTRLYIGEFNRFAPIFYPAILVRSNGGKYAPISMNRNYGTIEYKDILYQDGYGNESIIKRPSFFITAGAWEGSFSIEINTRSKNARDEIVEKVAFCFTDIYFDSLVDVGVIVKPLSYSGTTETDDRNDKLFKQTITLDVRCEWERAIPIDNFIETILFVAEIADIQHNSPPAPNLTIYTELLISDVNSGLYEI